VLTGTDLQQIYASGDLLKSMATGWYTQQLRPSVFNQSCGNKPQT